MYIFLHLVKLRKIKLLKKHGRWHSETAKDGYVKDWLPDRLSVSKNLGL
jgi:hypothetical protein